MTSQPPLCSAPPPPSNPSNHPPFISGSVGTCRVSSHRVAAQQCGDDVAGRAGSPRGVKGRGVTVARAKRSNCSLSSNKRTGDWSSPKDKWAGRWWAMTQKGVVGVGIFGPAWPWDSFDRRDCLIFFCYVINVYHPSCSIELSTKIINISLLFLECRSQASATAAINMA